MNILKILNLNKYTKCHQLITTTITSTTSITRSATSLGTNNSSILLENLSDRRGLIRIHGNEVDTFLQGLITNDVNHLSKPDTNGGIFALFLNKGGRILYDTIIYKQKSEEKTFLIECDKNITENLIKHLRLFRVRKKIDIDSVADEFAIWTLFSQNNESIKLNATEEQNLEGNKFFYLSDPRLKLLGSRLIVPNSTKENDIANLLPSQSIQPPSLEYNYKEHRYQLGVGEGIDELKLEKSFPFEANCDYLHGVSFHKGCYLGQELTARTYHTGVIRKRLMPIKLKSIASLSEEEAKTDLSISNEDGQAVGKLRGIGRVWALGLLRVEMVLKSKKLLIKDIEGRTSRPTWWPVEAPKQTKPSTN